MFKRAGTVIFFKKVSACMLIKNSWLIRTLESVQQRQILLNAFTSFFFGDVLPAQFVLNFSYYALN